VYAFVEGGKESVVISVNTLESPGCHCCHRDQRHLRHHLGSGPDLKIQTQRPRPSPILRPSNLAGARRFGHTPNHFYMAAGCSQGSGTFFCACPAGIGVLWCSHFRKVWFRPRRAVRCEDIVARSVAIIIFVRRHHLGKQLFSIESNCLLLLNISVYNLYGNCLAQ